MFCQAVVTTEDATKDASCTSAMMVQGALKDGTGITAMSGNANIFAVGLDGGSIKFIVDGI